MSLLFYDAEGALTAIDARARAFAGRNGAEFHLNTTPRSKHLPASDRMIHPPDRAAARFVKKETSAANHPASRAAQPGLCTGTMARWQAEEKVRSRGRVFHRPQASAWASMIERLIASPSPSPRLRRL